MRVWNPDWASACHQGGSPEYILSKSGKKKHHHREKLQETFTKACKKVMKKIQSWSNKFMRIIPFILFLVHKWPTSASKLCVQNRTCRCLTSARSVFRVLLWFAQASVKRDSASFRIHPVTTEMLYLVTHCSCCMCILMPEMKQPILPFWLLLAWKEWRCSRKESRICGKFSAAGIQKRAWLIITRA